MNKKKDLYFIFEIIDEDLQLYHSQDEQKNDTNIDSNFYESLEIGKIVTFENTDYKVVNFNIRMEDTWNNFIIYVERVEKN